MSRVLEQVREQQQALSVSPFMTLLQDSYFTPRMRLGFLPCLAPFVMGLPDFVHTLQEEGAGQAEGPGAGEPWSRYLADLKALQFETSADFAGTLQLLWGEQGNAARRTLMGLVELGARVGPVQRQVIRLALRAVGGVALRSLEQMARDLKACTGTSLTSLEDLRGSGWGVGALELDLSPEVEQESVAVVGEVFGLFTQLGDELLEYVLGRMAVEQDPLGWERTASLTFHEFGSARLRALCEAVGYGAQELETVQRFFSAMSAGWGSQRIGSSPRWLSEITDDHTPYEFSLALEEGRPEVRFLIEQQGSPTTLESSWRDGLALTERLHEQFGVPLERFNQVKELFEPHNPGARFSLWHAFGLKANGEPSVKVYFNPKARGEEHSDELVREALARLGFANAWRFISEVAMRRGAKDQLVYFSLDLSAHAAARIKVYIAHQDATAEEIEALMAHGKEYTPGEAYAFYRRLQGAEACFSTPRSTQTCLSFTSDDDARPSGVQLYVPVRCYAENDLDAMRRVKRSVERSRYEVLEQAVQALAHRPLEAGVGLVQWAAMRREGGRVRTTFYLATEAYSNAAARARLPQATFLLPTESGAEFRLSADA